MLRISRNRKSRRCFFCTRNSSQYNILHIHIFFLITGRKLKQTKRSWKFLHSSLLFVFIIQDIKFSSDFTAEFFEIEATDFYLEPDAKLDCSGRGFQNKTTGSGRDSSSGGSGAGHGTPGGDGAVVSGGEEVGSVYEPVLPGASGGTRIGGAAGSRGGGRVRVVVGFAFRLDGIINVDADNAPTNSG